MRTRALTILLAALAVTAAAMTHAPQAWGAASPSSSDCGAGGYPAGWNIWCQSASATPAHPAAVSNPGTVSTPCALYPVAGNPTHMLQVCPLPVKFSLPLAVNLPGATMTLVPAGGAGGPPVTPQQLLAWAQNELALPLPGAQTAPPRGSDGLVGLPEWFWVNPAQWHPVSALVNAGGAWAQVTATPARIEIQPGPAGGVTCPGPGTPYDPQLAASAQHTACSYTYAQSSDTLPGNTYQASVTVVWTATWQGSGGAGGALAPLGRTTTFAVPVAEAQALNPGS
jgi:hypothetical protein